jgi:hypothetical protein
MSLTAVFLAVLQAKPATASNTNGVSANRTAIARKDPALRTITDGHKRFIKRISKLQYIRNGKET